MTRLTHTRSPWFFWALAVVITSCVVTDTEQDILDKLWKCNSASDCARGWECRPFSLDVSGDQYCVLPCTADNQCHETEFCSNEGFCVERCDLDAPGCRDPKLTCMRANLTPGTTLAYCQPAQTCNQSADCPQGLDSCVSELLSENWVGLQVEEEDNFCVEGCPGGSCADGFVCASSFAQAFSNLGNFPPVCVPKCGVENSCAIGLRCLIDALSEFDPIIPTDPLVHKVCVPGFPSVPLPCRSDMDCLLGLCVRHPIADLPGGGPLYTCALPCNLSQGCAINTTNCLPSVYQGEPGDFCFGQLP